VDIYEPMQSSRTVLRIVRKGDRSFRNQVAYGRAALVESSGAIAAADHVLATDRACIGAANIILPAPQGPRRSSPQELLPLPRLDR
jgi:hypothetical protein